MSHLTLIQGEDLHPTPLPPGRFRERLVTSIRVGDLVDLDRQYGWAPHLYSPVEKITRHRDGFISIRVAFQPWWPDWRKPKLRRTERFWIGRKRYVQRWEAQ